MNVMCCQRKRKIFCESSRARVEKIKSGQLANRVPFWHYLGISAGTHQLDQELHAHVFRHCSASRVHPDSLPSKGETFLRVAPRARALKKSGPASWPGKCHFGTIWVYRREHTSLTQKCKGTLSAIVRKAKSTQIRSRRSQKLLWASRRVRVLKIRSCQLLSHMPFWHYLGILPAPHHLDRELQAHVVRHCSASRIHADSLPAITETILGVAPRARVEKFRSGQLASPVSFRHHLGISPWDAAF